MGLARFIDTKLAAERRTPIWSLASPICSFYWTLG